MEIGKGGLYADIKSILEQARGNAVRAVNFSMVIAYWEIGKRIVEEEQHGSKRAVFGQATLKQLSVQLSNEFGKGFDESNLRNMRLFYQAFLIRDALRHELSWTHYRFIMKVENTDARNYYMNEAAEQNWSTRVLERQINSLYFQRLLSSKNKQFLIAKAETENQQDQPTIFDFVKDPYILEFLQLQSNATLLALKLQIKASTTVKMATVGIQENLIFSVGGGAGASASLAIKGALGVDDIGTYLDTMLLFEGITLEQACAAGVI